MTHQQGRDLHAAAISLLDPLTPWLVYRRHHLKAKSSGETRLG